MDEFSWPSEAELDGLRRMVAELSGKGVKDVKVILSPYRICPLGAHIDHQGGIVSAMTINKGVLLGFVPSGDSQVILRSGQFKGEVAFSLQMEKHIITKKKGVFAKVSNFSSPTLVKFMNFGAFIEDPRTEDLLEECNWGSYARGAVYALQTRGHHLKTGITGIIYGSKGLDSSGLSSSAAVGVAYLLALESANNLSILPTKNIEYDRLIENEYLGLKNGILDQSAILLSSYGCLTCINCKTKEHKLIHPPQLHKSHKTNTKSGYKILLAFSGLKEALTNNPGYNRRVAECQEAARVLLRASGDERMEPLLCNVAPEAYETHKSNLEPHLARRAEHYFSENMRVTKGLTAWASGNIEEFGKLISASGRSSIQNYECGCEPLIQLYEILLMAPGVYGARFSGAGFRGCCLAFVDVDCAKEAVSYVKNEYRKLQPDLASQINPETAVLICDVGDCARLI